MKKNQKELTEKELIEICAKHYAIIRSYGFFEKVKAKKLFPPIRKEIRAAFPVGMQLLKKNKKFLTSELMSEPWYYDNKKSYALLTLKKLHLNIDPSNERGRICFHFVDENFAKVSSDWYYSPNSLLLGDRTKDFIKELYDDLALDFKILK